MELNNLTMLLSKRGERTKLSLETGISTGNISDWFNPNKQADPSATHLIKMAKYFNCSIDYLLDLTETKNSTTPIYRFPVYEQRAAAGIGIEGRDGIFDMFDIQRDKIPNSAVCGVIIRGTSMECVGEHSIPDKSIALIITRYNKYLINGRIVIANLHGKIICKQFNKLDDQILFKSLNENEQDKTSMFRLMIFHGI